jgi:RNA polymerase sigma-70 factor (ECF subfamily)
MAASPPVSGANPAGDAALLAALRRGDDGAFEQLVRVQGARLLAVTRRILGPVPDAEDAVQDAFASAFRALPGFEGQCLLSTWLYRIAVNAALMRLRARRRRAETPLEDLLPRFLEDGTHQVHPAPWVATPQSLLEQREVREGVRAAIEGLPDSYREVLLLRDIEELDTREVASLLEISENLVKVRLHRARQALRTLLEPMFREARP